MSGHFAALSGKKALKQQIHSYRIHGRDAQRVANRAIRRRAAPLHQNVALPAEADHVPDDQEISFELQLFDHLQFAFQLQAGFFVIRAVTAVHPFHGPFAQEFRL